MSKYQQLKRFIQGEEDERPLVRADRLILLWVYGIILACVTGGLIGIPFFGWRSIAIGGVTAIMAAIAGGTATSMGA